MEENWRLKCAYSVDADTRTVVAAAATNPSCGRLETRHLEGFQFEGMVVGVPVFLVVMALLCLAFGEQGTDLAAFAFGLGFALAGLLACFLVACVLKGTFLAIRWFFRVLRPIASRRNSEWVTAPFPAWPGASFRGPRRFWLRQHRHRGRLGHVGAGFFIPSLTFRDAVGHLELLIDS